MTDDPITFSPRLGRTWKERNAQPKFLTQPPFEVRWDNARPGANQILSYKSHLEIRATAMDGVGLSAYARHAEC